MDPASEFSFWEAITKAAEDAHGRGDLELAEKHYKQAIDHAVKSFGAEHERTAYSWLCFGDFLEHQERYSQGEIAYRKAVELYDKYGNRLLFAMAMRNLAQVVCLQGRHEEGAALGEQARVILCDHIQRN